ncbi:MAG TPA: M24 family metallopeptidase [Alphaproteobacteria bacterium]|nr:M24 family metallopeptidase [Alphaproteobacteria bacterium]
MAARYFPIDEYEHRWRLVHAEMERRGFDTAVVWGRSGGNYCRCGDVLYLVNYYGNSSGQGLDTPFTNARSFAAVILEKGKAPELQSDEAWPRKDLIATDRIAWSRNTIDAVAQSLKRRNVKGPVALVGTDFLPMKYWRQLEAATPGVEWQAADDLVRTVRRIKTTRELDCFREGGRIVTRALNLLMEGLIAGKSEAEAAGDAAREVVRAGGAIHMIPCSHGDMIEYFVREPLPGYGHHAPKPGDLVRGWVYGPMFQGYYLDPGRTAVAGRRPSNTQAELIETGVGIIEKLIAAIRPGKPLMEVAQSGDRMMAEAGAEKDQAAEKFPLYGHGLGLFFEHPYISTVMGNPKDVFEEGMVMGIEIFMARKGVGSVGLEQNVIVTPTGTELLTTSPMIWW